MSFGFLMKFRSGLLFKLMAEKTYAEKLQDPRWQRKRLEVMSRDNFTCRHCKTTESSLNIHHIAYNHGDPWDIKNELLITLCQPCHEKEGERIKTSFASLINILKSRGCMSDHVDAIASAFSELPDEFFEKYTVDFGLMYFFSNRTLLESILKKYEDSMTERIEQDGRMD